MPPMLFIVACAGIVVAPFLFESYTFYLCMIGEPVFFVFSGARLWFFFASAQQPTQTQQAYFYQAGVSTSIIEVQYGQITFGCPSYYDMQGAKQCILATAISGGNSHWKVVWKRGLPNGKASVAAKGTNVTVGLG